MAVTAGTTALVARAWGAGDRAEAEHVTRVSLGLCAGIALLISVPVMLLLASARQHLPARRPHHRPRGGLHPVARAVPDRVRGVLRDRRGAARGRRHAHAARDRRAHQRRERVPGLRTRVRALRHAGARRARCGARERTRLHGRRARLRAALVARQAGARRRRARLVGTRAREAHPRHRLSRRPRTDRLAERLPDLPLDRVALRHRALRGLRDRRHAALVLVPGRLGLLDRRVDAGRPEPRRRRSRRARRAAAGARCASRWSRRSRSGSPSCSSPARSRAS